MKVIRLILVLLPVVCSCCTSQESKKTSVAEILPGFWWFQEKDSTYAEVVLTDSIYWFYHDAAGVWQFDYRLTQDDSVQRFYRGSHDQLNSFKIERAAHDTVWVHSNTNYRYVMHRIKLDLDPDKVVTPGSAAAEQYVVGYRARRASFRTSK